MSARILRGTKQEIAANLSSISGEVREAIVFVEEAAPTPEARSPDVPDMFDEMRAFMVDAGQVDDSREAIYSRMDGE